MKHYDLAVLSKSAYRTMSHSSAGVEATFSLIEGEQVLAFRGTSFDRIDIIRDMRGLPWYSGRLGAWCHSGFLKGARGFLQETSIVGDIDPRKPLVLTGHSLGGALAVGAGAFLTLLGGGRRPAEIVTYGAPAFSYGRSVGRILEDVPTTQYKNGIDIVPGVPWFGKHVPKLTRLGTVNEDLFFNHRIQEYLDGLAAP